MMFVLAVAPSSLITLLVVIVSFITLIIISKYRYYRFEYDAFILKLLVSKLPGGSVIVIDISICTSLDISGNLVMSLCFHGYAEGRVCDE